MNNLEAILLSGCLLADTKQPQPVVDISSTGNRDERRAASVDTETVAQYVPFFVTPDSAVWEGIRSEAPDSRLSADARHHAPAEFVMLVSTVDRAGRENAVIAVGDAADAGTRFVTAAELMGRELHRLHEDADALRQAEFLVWESFPFESITLIGVANDRARDEVKDILRSAAHKPKVSVYPPWFARPEA